MRKGRPAGSCTGSFPVFRRVSCTRSYQSGDGPVLEVINSLEVAAILLPQSVSRVLAHLLVMGLQPALPLDFRVCGFTQLPCCTHGRSEDNLQESIAPFTSGCTGEGRLGAAVSHPTVLLFRMGQGSELGPWQSSVLAGAGGAHLPWATVPGGR